MAGGCRGFRVPRLGYNARLNHFNISGFPMRIAVFLLGFCLPALFCMSSIAQERSLGDALKVIKGVGVAGLGHEDAVKAMATLNAASADDIPEMLQGMEGASRLSLNWIRGAIQSSLDRGVLPNEEVEAYWRDVSGSHMGRLMAYELLVEANPDFSSNHVASMLEDPSLPLRQLAVQDFIDRSQATEDSGEAVALLAQALPHARDNNQIAEIAKLLAVEGIEVDLQKQLGVLSRWHVVGPFDNTGEIGFEEVFGPEKAPGDIDLSATYADSKNGTPVTWRLFNTLDSAGVVNLNELLGEEKGVVAYAFAEFDAVAAQEVDIRIGCINGNKVWVNGEEVLNNEIHHVGMMMDQFVGRSQLKKGVNQILFKVCQNEQSQPWANRWAFQLRVCEDDGKAVSPAKKIVSE